MYLLLKAPWVPLENAVQSSAWLHGSHANAKGRWVVQHWSNCNDRKGESSPRTTFTGDFLLVVNLKLFEVGPQDNIQEIHLGPLSSAHLKESPDWKLATLRGKTQADRLKLLFLFTYLKCRLRHCSKSPCLNQHGSQSPWNGLCRPFVL